MNCNELQIGNKNVFSIDKQNNLNNDSNQICICNKLVINDKTISFDNNNLKETVEINNLKSHGLVNLPNKLSTKTFSIENKNSELKLTSLIKEKRFKVKNMNKLICDDIEYIPINWNFSIKDGISVDIKYRVLVYSKCNEIEIISLEISTSSLITIEENSVYGIHNILAHQYKCPIFFLDENDKLISEDQYRMKTLCCITGSNEVYDIIWCKYKGIPKKFATLRNDVFNYDNNLFQIETKDVKLELNNSKSNYKINFNTNSSDPIDICIIDQVIKKLESIVTTSLTLDITINIETMDSGILGSAGPGNRYIKKNGYYLPECGSVTLNKLYWDTEKLHYRNNYNVSAYYTLLHETCHVLGIGPLWVYNELLNHGPWYNTNQWWYSDFTRSLYVGENGLREYKLIQERKHPNHGILQGIPIEEDGGVGTKGGHIEEGDNRHSKRYFDGVEHFGLDNELMSGWAESSTITEPLSRITVGFLEDIGYSVNYDNADYF